MGWVGKIIVLVQLNYVSAWIKIFEILFLSDNMSKILVAYPVDASAAILAVDLLNQDINNEGRIACNFSILTHCESVERRA